MNGVNVSSREFRLFINGQNCTPYLDLFEVGDSKWEADSGLVLCTGTITLRGNLGNPLDLDDRTNPIQWARGNLCVLDIANSAGDLTRHPRGYLRILQPNYNPIERTLTLTVGDELVLRQAEAPPGDGPGVRLGQSTTRTAIINTLLQKAGAPSLFGGISEYPINYPLPLVTGSYVQQAGAVAATAGYFLWCDGLGSIRASKVSLAPTKRLLYRIVGRNELLYERVSGPEAPAQKVRVSGTAYKPAPFGQDETQGEEIGRLGDYLPESPYADITLVTKRWRERETIDRLNHRRKVERWEDSLACITMPSFYPTSTSMLPALYKVTTYYYEPAIDSPGLNPQNQQRLLKEETEQYRQMGVVFKAWYDKHPADKATALSTYSMWDLTAAPEYRETKTYKYSNLATLQAGEVFKVSSQRYDQIAALLTDLPFGLTVYLGVLRLSETSSTAYEKLSTTKWRKTDTLLRAAVLIGGDTLKKIPNPTIDAKLSLREVSGSNKSEISTSGQLQPPQAEHFPAENELQQRPVKGEARVEPIAGTFQERLRNYSVEYLAGDDNPGLVERQLQELARIRAGILIGRYRGQVWAAEFDDGFFDYEPIASAINFQEQGATYTNLVDGCAWTLNNRRCMVAGEGIWVGTLINPDGTNYTYSPTDAAPLPDPAIVSGLAIVPPYLDVLEIEGGIGVGSDFADIPPGVADSWPPLWEAVTEEQWIGLSGEDWVDMGPPASVRGGIGVGSDFGLT